MAHHWWWCKVHQVGSCRGWYWQAGRRAASSTSALVTDQHSLRQDRKDPPPPPLLVITNHWTAQLWPPASTSMPPWLDRRRSSWSEVSEVTRGVVGSEGWGLWAGRYQSEPATHRERERTKTRRVKRREISQVINPFLFPLWAVVPQIDGSET